MKLIPGRAPSAVGPHVVRLHGGLGNQMFQYAFGQTLRKKTGFAVHYDAHTFFLGGRIKGTTPREYSLGDLNVDVPLASGAEIEYFGLSPLRALGTGLGSVASNLITLKRRRRIIQEKGFAYKSHALSRSRSARYFLGYWQSERYLMGIEETIRIEFQPRTALSLEALELKHRIKESGAACINVRRGDFVSDEKTRQFHGYMDTDYYLAALSRLRERGSFDNLFIFSDEPEWCSSNLRLPGNVEVVPHRFAGPNFSHYMNLMTSCLGFVIPNSTFGWWAAWLAKVPGDNIVAPKNWFADKTIDTSDIVPKSWIRL